MSNTETPAAQVLKKLKALWADSRSYGTRLLYIGSVMLALSFTFVFFGPLEMVAFGGNSLEFTYEDVLLLLGIAALAVFVIGSLLLALLRGKIFNYVACTLFALTLCGYLQAAFLNGDLGALTGDAILWTAYRGKMIMGLGIWLAILLVLFLIMYLHRKLWSRIMMFVSLILVVMQLAPTVGILLGSYEDAEPESISSYLLTEAGMYEYAEEDNIFVFVLDRLDYDYIDKVLAENPDFFAPLDGFTAYTNATSVFARTQPALNHMLTGSDELAYVTPVSEYYERSWSVDGKDLLGTLKEQGYTNRMYTNVKYLFSDPEYGMERVENMSDGKGEIRQTRMLKNMMYLSAYRYAPTALKPFFWADTNYYNDVFAPMEVDKYLFNDTGHAPGFRTAALGKEDKNFKLYHFMGPHAPYTMNADGTKSETSTTVTAQTMGSFNNLYAAFEQMKALGIYEDAAIIITADHGAAVSDSKPVSKPTRIGLFYKPSGSAGTPLTYSAAQVSTENIPATLLKAAGADYSAYGKALDEISEDDQITRPYIKSVTDGGGSGEQQIYKYDIVGDAADFDNWKVTEVLDIEHGFY